MKEKINIRDFVENYNKRPNQMKENYIKDNLEIVSYIPFVKKKVIADNIVSISMYKYENKENENGVFERKKTNVLNIDSSLCYLLYCRAVIENYTNLQIETDSFFEEYDLLKQSGLLDRLLVGSENMQSLIPIDELTEIKTLIDMRKNDELTNKTTTQAYISSQIERFGELSGIALKPAIDRLLNVLENMTENDFSTMRNTVNDILKMLSK